MDLTVTDFPILTYIMFGHPPELILPTQPEPGYDIEQPPPLPPPQPKQSPQFIDPLLERLPHLKDPKVIATMTEAVTSIAKTRSLLRTLGERPDHETIDIARAKLHEIESDPTHELEEIELSPGALSNGVEKKKREKVEREKEKYKALIKLDEMHEEYEKKLRESEERLMKVYDTGVVVENGGDNGEEGELGFDEEVVSVLKQEMIERVDLSCRKLKVLPEPFGRLRALLQLNLSGNLLQTIPDSIAGLGNLQEWNLSHNSLQSLPDSIGLLLNLKYLNISGNKLCGLPDSISHCRSLIELDASFNTLGYLPTNIGYELVNLEKLLVPYNKIRSLPSSIGELKSLQDLDLHFNELHGLPVTIGKLTNLMTLNLSGNFSDLKELPESFGELINLEELDLSNNQIHALPDTFFNLEKLVKLNLEHNPIVVPPIEIVNNGVERVLMYMVNRWAHLIQEEEEEEEEEMKREQMEDETREPGWLTRSVSKLGDVVLSVSDYLGSPRPLSRDPFLDQEL